jgi:class 3 adenylate cyclase
MQDYRNPIVHGSGIGRQCRKVHCSWRDVFGRGAVNSHDSILVVDDAGENRELLTDLLHLAGYTNIVSARNGREAVFALEDRPFDLVLLDLVMPELDGIQTLTAIKANPGLHNIPVVMISAAGEVDSIARCIQLGAEDYLRKPFNSTILRARVSACLEKKHLRDQELLQRAEIERQRSRLRELLHAILPAQAVSELEQTGSVQPRRYANVVVLFCDIADFTRYCDTHPPETVVANLQVAVDAFERLAAKHGLEKLKTVGDALLATAGLLSNHPDPVMAGLRCAFDFIDAVRSGPAGWQMRCGLHVGPVVAGVVGREKFSFDLWGDTVNVAARLADLDGLGCVYVSEIAWAQVQDRCPGERLGSVLLRGKGHIPVIRCTDVGHKGSGEHAPPTR